MTTKHAPDLNAVTKALSLARPVFHSESDFKHAFSWQVQQDYPSVRVRQEVGNLIDGPHRRYVDIWLPDSRTAIVLKYLTRAAVVIHEYEEFRLRDQDARDAGQYDFCLDIARFEGIVDAKRANDGYATLLTNDHLYWNRPRKVQANDTDFVLHEEREITGTMAWSPGPGAGTVERPIEVRGRYGVHWREYSDPAGTGYTKFRYLLLHVMP